MKKLCLIVVAVLILTLVGCSTDNHNIDSQSNIESTTETNNQSTIEITTEDKKEQQAFSDTVVQTSEIIIEVPTEKEASKKDDGEKITDATTENQKSDSHDSVSNIDLDYAVYEKTENGLSLIVKIPKKVGVGQKFVAYATVKNVTDSTINYALSSSSESNPKIKLSISANGKVFTNIDTYGKAFTNDIVYKELKPNEEINVTYNLCPGKVNGSTISESNWNYFTKGEYSGVATFDFGGINSKQWNNKKITVDFSVEVI